MALLYIRDKTRLEMPAFKPVRPVFGDGWGWLEGLRGWRPPFPVGSILNSTTAFNP